MSKLNTLDQYYTNPAYAGFLCDKIKEIFGEEANYVEPSAGEGAFSSCFKNITSFDIDPKFEDCIEADFLAQSVESVGSVTAFVGNPPFGKNASLAIKFFNHCAEMLDNEGGICFILPRTFQKIFFAHKLNPHMHLLYEEECPKGSFILHGDPWDVPCVFQIWIKRNEKRFPVVLGENRLFVLGNSKDYDIAVRRAGASAGKVLSEEDSLSEASTYFLKALTSDLKTRIIEAYPLLKAEASKTAGVRSLSLKELQWVLENIRKEE